MGDFDERVVLLNPTEFAELFGNFSELVNDMYDRLKNGIIYITRDVNVYITDDMEETVFRESELDDPNSRTDYYDMFIHHDHIEDYMIEEIEPGVYTYHFTETITNYLNTDEDILRARFMLNNIQLQYIINPQLRDRNNCHYILQDLRRKLAHVVANDMERERLIDPNDPDVVPYEDQDDHPVYW